MKITYYANACFSIFHNDIHILCDPWMEGAAVAGGWTQFPPCETSVEDIPAPDFIYISHIHSDHCEAETLEKLNKSTPVIIIDREPNFLARMLYRTGFNNLVMVPEKKPTEIAPGLVVETYGGTYDHLVADIIDSSILFKMDNIVVLNCNDNLPEEDFCNYIAEHHPSVDLALFPSGGAGGFPAMYTNMTEDEKLSTIGKILETTTEKFTSAIDIIRPNIVIPVAGGYAIKGAMSETVNWLQIRRLNLMELVDHYQEHGKTGAKIIPLQHGMVVDVEKGEVVEGAYHVWSKEELSRHFAMVGKQEMQYAVNTSRKLPTMGKLIDRARKQLWEKQQQINIFVDYTVILDIEGEDQLIHIKLDEAETHHLSRDESLETPYLKMTLDQDTMLEWLLGFEDFNMLDSGHRISFHREPNDYVQEAYMLMSYFHLN